MADPGFPENLRWLCSFEASVSEACRGMQINRQQFSKYLAGSSRPSDRNLRRICTYFRVEIADLHLPHDEFLLSEAATSRTEERSVRTESFGLQAAFENQRTALRSYLGGYHCYFKSFNWPGRIHCALTLMHDRDGSIYTRTIERYHDPLTGSLFLSKYSGQATFLYGRIFIVEFQTLAKDTIIETVLYPQRRTALNVMPGVTFGVSAHHRGPHMETIVWKYLGANVDLRLAMEGVGLHDPRSRAVDPAVRTILANSEKGVQEPLEAS